MFSSSRIARCSDVAAVAFVALLGIAGCGDMPDRHQDRLSALDSICPTADQQTVAKAVDSEFGNNVIKEITTRAFYPAEALKADQHGRTVLCIRYQQNGRLDRALVRESSGYPLLDGAALYATGLYATTSPRPGDTAVSLNSIHLRDLPPPPAELLAGRSAVWMDVPVSFEISKATQQTEASSEPLLAQDSVENGCTARFAPRARLDLSDAQRSQIREFAGDTSTRFQQHIFYPPAARAIAMSGSAVLRFALVDRRFECAWLVASSGEPLFDGVALMTVGYTLLDQRQVAETKQLPDGLFGFELPINFQLRP